MELQTKTDMEMESTSEATQMNDNMKSHRELIKYNQKQDKSGKIFSTHIKVCATRLFSNVLIEIISLSCILAYLILLGKWMNGELSIDHSSFVWLLLPASIEYGIVPYVLTVIGWFLKEDNNSLNEVFYITMSSLNGILNFRMYTILWHQTLGIRILSFGCLFVTFILYVLFTFDIIKLGYCFIPLLVYSTMFELTFLLVFNCVECPDSITGSFTTFRILHFLFLYSSVIISCVLTMIKLLGDVSWSYTILSVPWCISIGLIPFINCGECCVILCLFFQRDSVGFPTDRNFIEETLGLPITLDRREGELWRSLFDCCMFFFFSPLAMTSIVLFSQHLDSKITFSYVLVFVPLFVFICGVILINSCLLFCCKWYRCPFYLCPDWCGILKTLFCCTKCSKDPYYSSYQSRQFE